MLVITHAAPLSNHSNFDSLLPGGALGVRAVGAAGLGTTLAVDGAHAQVVLAGPGIDPDVFQKAQTRGDEWL